MKSERRDAMRVHWTTFNLAYISAEIVGERGRDSDSDSDSVDLFLSLGKWKIITKAEHAHESVGKTCCIHTMLSLCTSCFPFFFPSFVLQNSLRTFVTRNDTICTYVHKYVMNI